MSKPSEQTWPHADDLLFEITKYGPSVVINDDSYKTIMPAYENTWIQQVSATQSVGEKSGELL